MSLSGTAGSVIELPLRSAIGMFTLPHVRFGSKADICSAKRHVRFAYESDIKCDKMECPLWPKADTATFTPFVSTALWLTHKNPCLPLPLISLSQIQR